MSPLTLKPEHQRHPRSGFSLIELMAVIAIIGILLALFLPALSNTRDTVRTTEVATEIKGFEQGIAEFKLQFGMEPPSRIVLYEAAADWSSDTQSTTLLRQMWSQFDFTGDRDLDQDGTPGESDPDGDGTNGITLTGDECLLFFLGGSGTIAPAGQAVADGFSSNPADPFAAGGNRVGPFGEFDPDRMIDLDGDGAHSYKDIYVETNAPYLYLSSYDGRGYRVANDGNALNTSSPVVPLLFISIDDDGNGTQDEVGYSVYMQKDPNSLLPNSSNTTPESGQVPWNKNGFQIICAGGDGIFGCPGIWSDEGGLEHNFPGSEQALNLSEAQDNITNFSGGRLGQ